MVNSVGSNYNFAGTMMPNQSGKTPVQTTNTDGVQVRITPSNFRQVLGPNSDVLLTPQNMKDMFDKGYLDVKKSSSVMESNEGTFTILAKAIGALIGPSRTLGAITIDPNFMEMIKDPNAKIGAGYTRVSNESLEVLASPKDDPPPPNAKAPMMPSIWPKQIQPEAPGKHDRKEYNPVEMTRVQLETAKVNHPKIEVGTLGTYNHDKPSPQQVDGQGHIVDANHDGVLTEEESGIRPKSQAVVDALKSGTAEGAFEVSIQTNSNILRPDKRPDYNSNATDGLSQRRKQSASDLVGGNLKEASQNGDAKHTEILGNDFGLNVVSSQGGHKDKNGVVHFSKGAVMVAPKNPNDKPQAALAAATNEMIDTGRLTGGGKGILQTNADILKDGKPCTTPEAKKQIARIDAIAEKVGKDKGLTPDQTKALKQEMYKVAQSFVDNRSFDAEVTVKDFDQAKKWVDAHAGDPQISGSQIYKDVKAQVDSQQSTGSAAKDAVGAIERNFAQVSKQPASNLVGKEDIQSLRAQIKQVMPEASPAQKEAMQKLDAQLAQMETKTPSVLSAKRDLLVQNLDAAAKPGTNIDTHDDQVLANQIQEVGGMKSVPPGPITIGGKTYNDPKAVDGTGKPVPPKNWESILADVHAVAKQDLVIGSDKPVFDPAKVKANIGENMGVLTNLIGDVAGGKRVNPESIQHFKDGIQADIDKLPPADKATAQKALDDLTTNNPNSDVQEMMKQVSALGTRDALAAQDGKPGPTAGENIGKSLDDFHRYVKEVVADGQVDFTERQGMKDYVSAIASNLVGTLQSSGVPINPAEAGNPARQLAAVTPEMLAKAKKPDGSPAFQGKDLDQMVKNLNSVKSATVAINLCSEGSYTASLYQNVKHLDQQLTNFEKVGVVKTAFRSTMQNLAKEATPPERFNSLMQLTYGLPPCPAQRTPENAKTFDAYTTLQNEAKEGKLPMPPNVDVVSRSQLGGANGAYVRPTNGDPGSGRILLADDLGDQPDLMVDVFTEEMFHHLDHHVSTQILEATQNLDTADRKISQMIGPLNNAREDVTKSGPGQTAVQNGDLAGLQAALTPEVNTKANGWLQDQMSSFVGKGPDALPAAKTALADKLKNCGVGESDAQAQAAAMLTVKDGKIQLGSVSDDAVKKMVSEITFGAKDGSKPLKLDGNRGPTGALNGPNPPQGPHAQTLKDVMGVADMERGRSRLRLNTSSEVDLPDSKHSDAQGDEGRAGLYALKAMLGNRDMTYVKFEADRGRREEVNLNGNGAINRVNRPDAQTGNEIKDQGVAARDIIVDGQVVVPQNTQMEFSSVPQGQGQGNGGGIPSVSTGGTTAVGNGTKPGSGPATLNAYRSQARPMNEVPTSPPPAPGGSAGFKPVAHSQEEAAKNGQTLQSAEFDEKKGTGSAVASMMLDVLPKGLQSAGQALMVAAEGWQKKIKELYASIIKPISKAEETIYGGAGPWDHDVEVGRTGDYDSMQTNKRFNQVTPSDGKPDYGKVARENAERERQRQAAEEKKHAPNPAPGAKPQNPGQVDTQTVTAQTEVTTTRRPTFG